MCSSNKSRSVALSQRNKNRHFLTTFNTLNLDQRHYLEAFEAFLNCLKIIINKNKREIKIVFKGMCLRIVIILN